MMKGMAVVKKTSKFTKDILTGIITGIVSTLIISWFITPLTNLIFPKVIVFLENISMPFVLQNQEAAFRYFGSEH